MADDIDRAHEVEEQNKQHALANRRHDGPPAVGACLFCGELLGPGERWCDADCRDDWEADQAPSGPPPRTAI